ncbi:MAG: 2Fe-2S iron-sulfur cluster-binding protein [Sphingobium sp.]
MAAYKVTFVEASGAQRPVDAEEGLSLMEIARQNGVEGIMGDCGGACSCATCHVFVDEAWREKVGAPDDIELDMLDMVSDVAQDNSRLCCQIRMREELDGLTVTVAPSSAY